MSFKAESSQSFGAIVCDEGSLRSMLRAVVSKVENAENQSPRPNSKKSLFYSSFFISEKNNRSGRAQLSIRRSR